MKNDTKRLVTLAMLVSVAMILSYLESLVPPLVAIPGVKLGLSNVATLFALLLLGPLAAVSVSLVRVFLSALLFGNAMALIFSLSGACLSLLVMIIFSRTKFFSPVGISIIGAVAHNAGQIIAAAIVLKTSAIVYYLAPLVVSGTLAGTVIGTASGLLAKRLEKILKLGREDMGKSKY